MNYPQPDSAVRSAALELTLCPACARYFYNAPDVIIRRLDSFQQVKELCSYCGVRFGWDYTVLRNQSRWNNAPHNWEKSTM